MIVVTCLALSAWQFDRLQTRRADNARLITRSQQPPAPLEELAGGAEEAALYRRAEAAGGYDLVEEVLLRSRSYQGRPGHHLLTPLVTASGTALIVDRGWVPLDVDEPGATRTQAPQDRVEVTGILLASESKGFLSLADPPPGEVDSLPRADLDRLSEQLPYPVYPLYLRLQEQVPPNPGDLPEPVPVPEPDDGPHLSYAVQWLFFAVAAAVVYGALVRKERRKAEAGRRNG